jgi:hypothetical protein
MNENDIGQVYFSHPHNDGGTKQWILHTCAGKVIDADFERKTIGFSWTAMSFVILPWLWSSARWITARWRSCHLVNTLLMWPHTSILAHSLKVNIGVKQKRCQEIKWCNCWIKCGSFGHRWWLICVVYKDTKSVYGLWFRASSNIQIKQPTRCTLSCKIFYCLVL